MDCTSCAIIAQYKGKALSLGCQPPNAIPPPMQSTDPNSPRTPETLTSFSPSPAACASSKASKAIIEGRSIVEIAQSTGLSRAAIRRILLTLELLGYVERSRQVYRLKTQVLRLGFSFLSSSSVVEAARPVLEQITEQVHESSSMSMLDGGQIVYVARSAASRILAAGLSVGSRLPAYCTSMGRVLLAALPDDQLNAYLQPAQGEAYTPKTMTACRKLRKPSSRSGKTATPSSTRNSRPVFARSLSPSPRAAIRSWRPSTSALTFRVSTTSRSLKRMSARAAGRGALASQWS